MIGRFTKLIAGFAVSAMVFSAMGNSSYNAYAVEPKVADMAAESEKTESVIEYDDNDVSTDPEIDDTADELEIDDVIIESEAEGNVTESEIETPVTEIEELKPALEDKPGEESEVYTVDDSDSLGLDACFYIRTNVEEAVIPDEPSDQPTQYYSDGIRVNEAVLTDSFVYDNNITSNLCDDGYTASNGVSGKLLQVPSVADIQRVYPSFDPNTQYVLWYVIKQALTPYPDWDVFIHVDGVVLPKEIAVEPEEPETPAEPADPIEPEKPEEQRVKSDLEFEIYSANVEPPFEYDGEEHLIGGYVIRVTDRANGDSAQYTYGPYGDFRGVVLMKLNSVGANVPGTTFDFMGIAFNINVDSAYLFVKNPGNYEIPFFFEGKEVSPADIIIRDVSGKILDAHTDIKTPPLDNAVSQRKITITAGSTVQNDNGETITNENVTISSGSLLPGHRLVTSIVGSQTGPGESVNEITYYDIIGSDGKSYKAMYDVTKENGWLILVKPSDGGTSKENSSLPDTESVLSGDASESVSTALPIVLGEMRKSDGTTALLSRNNETGSVQGDISFSDDTDSPQVLGARRGDTSDVGIPAEIRLVLIILCLMAIMVINIRRSNS